MSFLPNQPDSCLQSVCLASSNEIYQQLLASELLALSLCCRGIVTKVASSLPVRHLQLGRRGGGDGRDYLVLEAMHWEELESIQATQISLYAVQEGLLRQE
eukprot:TRINITY_DN44478_c0_g1_i1.p1 TRINITY_DN44478_c0_g1~~TRINITY_DN44478_c0_g1_i1.p1  ORF type:complete len:101 (+),score=20.77 TRINITY_DN44478_c0_g1_i1:112-414(+)